MLHAASLPSLLMYRFALRPRWVVFHLVVAAAVVAMVNLGLWQLRRLDERQSFNTTVEQRWDAPPVDIAVLLPPASDDTGTVTDTLEWRRVTARGTYLADEEIRVVNRSQNGRAGDNIVVPLLLDDSRVVLVTRGFVPLGRDPSPTPDGVITVEGHIRAESEPGALAARDPADGELRTVQRIDIDRLAPQIPGELLPLWIDLTVAEPAEIGPWPEPVIRPDLSEGSHLSYAVQWFIFSLAALAGWGVAMRTSARRNTARSTTD